MFIGSYIANDEEGFEYEFQVPVFECIKTGEEMKVVISVVEFDAIGILLKEVDKRMKELVLGKVPQMPYREILSNDSIVSA
jgi:hypothetical protein